MPHFFPESESVACIEQSPWPLIPSKYVGLLIVGMGFGKCGLSPSLLNKEIGLDEMGRNCKGLVWVSSIGFGRKKDVELVFGLVRGSGGLGLTMPEVKFPEALVKFSGASDRWLGDFVATVSTTAQMPWVEHFALLM